MKLVIRLDYIFTDPISKVRENNYSIIKVMFSMPVKKRSNKQIICLQYCMKVSLLDVMEDKLDGAVTVVEHVAKEILVQVKISMMVGHSDYSLFIMCHLYTSKTISPTIPCHMFWLKLKSLSEDYFSSGDGTSYYYCIL